MKTSKRVLYFVAFVTTAFYLTWRLVATIPWHDSWFALIFGILLWGSEVVSAITGYILIWNKQKDFELEKPEIAKERYPDVDVLIATHNEDPELLYKTINACTFMEYPDKSKVHIYVCDDTNRLEVSKLVILVWRIIKMPNQETTIMLYIRRHHLWWRHLMLI